MALARNSIHINRNSFYLNCLKKDFNCTAPLGINPKDYYTKLIDERDNWLLLQEIKSFLLSIHPDTPEYKGIIKTIKSDPGFIKSEHAQFKFNTTKRLEHLQSFTKIWQNLMSLPNEGDIYLFKTFNCVRNFFEPFCESGAVSLLRILLKKDANLLAPLRLRDNDKPLFITSYLHIAIAYFRADIIEELLLAETANVNSYYGDGSKGKDIDYLPISWAIINTLETGLIEQGKKVIKTLLAHGADPDLACNNFKSARTLCEEKLKEMPSEYHELLKMVIDSPVIKNDASLKMKMS